MPAPSVIKELVERFKFNINDYKKGNYNETQVRREFIDPFFKALGWDVANEKGYAEAYKDVVHEFSLKTKDKAEAPDYLFRIGGTKKFFVEAKKPSVNLKDDISPAFQLRRYAWSAKLPLSILTDFEELAVYDCRIQPTKTDKSSTARINYFTYEEYIDRWDEIESIFSRDAILKGSFDKFAESNKGKRGTAEVDDAFLKEIEKWRELLARNIALRNESLSNRELNFAVQKTIDRIIFLRICEDRGIEDYGQLMNLQNGANVYQRLLQIFTRADEKYNSGLFHFDDEKDRKEEPDKITPALSIDDDKLKEIIKNLYYPESPYEFSVLPSDILGHVYEQFLGKVIRLTPGHRAVVEEKPEVKKAGGVYYTPTYIVNYIVKNTLGKKLEEIEEKFSLTNRHSGLDPESIPNIMRAIKAASKIKVLDPACGSGSFLIGAYQYLLDWHIKLYSVEISLMKSLRKDSPVYQTKEGEYRLTTTEKKRILLNNIYGVDIDSQAVEVTKLSLLLKVLEGETEESLTTQLSMFRQRALPDLSSNIKCGNSLIGPDFYDQTELNLDEEEHYRINVFDWNEEFKEIMNDGGFDCVIGNPPYVRTSTLNKVDVVYFKNRYKNSEASDLYLLFIEMGIELLKNRGKFSYITPKFLLFNIDCETTRLMLSKYTIDKLVDVGKAFKKVNTECIITVIEKTVPNRHRVKVEELDLAGNLIREDFIKQNSFKDFPNSLFNIYLNERDLSIINKLLKSKALSTLVKIKRGMEIGKKDIRENKDGVKTLIGEDVKRFTISYQDTFVNKNHKEAKRLFEFSKAREKILIRRVSPKLIATIDRDQFWFTKNLYGAINDSNYASEYIVGLLNSSLLTYFFQKYFTTKKQDIFPKFQKYQLDQIPIKTINKDNAQYLKIVAKVKQIINLKSLVENVKTPQEKKNLERQIAALDKQIDRLVYELYGLTEDEIKIVEESIK